MILDVDISTSAIGPMSTGSPVDIATYLEGEARLVKGLIVSATPLQIRVASTIEADAYLGNPVTLLATVDGDLVRGEARVVAFEDGVLDFTDATWRPLDRRGFRRFEFHAQATLRVVVEGDSHLCIRRVGAEILDLSATGVYVVGGGFPPKGTLIEFQTHLDGREASCLGVIARVSEHGAGIHFVEYLGNSRELIEATLAQLG